MKRDPKMLYARTPFSSNYISITFIPLFYALICEIGKFNLKIVGYRHGIAKSRAHRLFNAHRHTQINWISRISALTIECLLYTI